MYEPPHNKHEERGDDGRRDGHPKLVACRPSLGGCVEEYDHKEEIKYEVEYDERPGEMRKWGREVGQGRGSRTWVREVGQGRRSRTWVKDVGCHTSENHGRMENGVWLWVETGSGKEGGGKGIRWWVGCKVSLGPGGRGPKPCQIGARGDTSVHTAGWAGRGGERWESPDLQPRVDLVDAFAREAGSNRPEPVPHVQLRKELLGHRLILPRLPNRDARLEGNAQIP